MAFRRQEQGMVNSRRLAGAASYRRGRHAEQVAMEKLAGEGWTILKHRARTPWGEIDLIAARGGMMIFVEVKCRPTFSQAASSLGTRQIRRLIDAASMLCAENPGWVYDEMRFDVIVVTADNAVHQIADAFRLE
ncbi:YraN family protein [Gluconacetobacter johannae]|uniref:UPF0102 protein HLH21_10460 n=2 Tax=Gluconacetobacter johannae TaxID=112140 RepID=A0A7W4J882_9PROT|nr:YraN family protein [Gluconacetobacter johannae]